MKRIIISLIAVSLTAMTLPVQAGCRSVSKVLKEFRKTDNALYLNTKGMTEAQGLEISMSATEEVAGGVVTNRSGMTLKPDEWPHGTEYAESISLYLCCDKARNDFRKAMEKALKRYDELMETSCSHVKGTVFIKTGDKDTVSEIILYTNADNASVLKGSIPVSELARLFRKQK